MTKCYGMEVLDFGLNKLRLSRFGNTCCKNNVNYEVWMVKKRIIKTG